MLKNIISIVTILFCISACGFRPIYSQNPSSLYLSSVKLHHIAYKEKVKSNIPYSLRKELENALPPNTPHKQKYNLDIIMTTSITGAAIQANTIAARKDIICQVQYKLTDIETQEIAFQDDVFHVESIDTEPSQFSNYISEEETLNRMMKNISSEIIIRLHSWFAKNEG